jgi:hypothetical protein
MLIKFCVKTTRIYLQKHLQDYVFKIERNYTLYFFPLV